MVIDSSLLLLRLKKAESVDQAFDLFSDLVASRGLGCYFFTQMNTQDSPTIFKVHHYRTSYPAAWEKAYFDNRYFYEDPIARRVMMNDTPFYWSEYLSQTPQVFSPETEKMFAHAASFGICDGVGFTYLKDKHLLYTLTVSSPVPFESYDPRLLSEFYLAGSYLVDIFESREVNQTDYPALTAKEKTVASMGAIGKTDIEIAMLTGISVNTVRYHWKNIFKKMDSYSRVFAIIRAINLGYLDTNVFEVTTDSGSIETYSKTI